jgi:histidine triad (HIT) family protein
MEDSVFTKIVKKEIFSFKVYEDQQTLAFLNIKPVSLGHTLIIPKKQVEFLWDLDDATYFAVMKTTRKLAKHFKEVLGVPYVGMQVVGVDVPHAHVHLIPFSDSRVFLKSSSELVQPTDEELNKIAKQLFLS